MQSSSCSGNTVESTSDVSRGPEPCQSGTALMNLSSFMPCLPLPTLELSFNFRSMVQCGRMRMRMTTITLRVLNLTLSSPKWSPHKHTYKYIYIYTYKTASCTSCIRGSLRLAPNYPTYGTIIYNLHTTKITLSIYLKTPIMTALQGWAWK